MTIGRGIWLVHLLAIGVLALGTIAGGLQSSISGRPTVLASTLGSGAMPRAVADQRDPSMRYRVGADQAVEVSRDQGQHWSVLLTPGLSHTGDTTSAAMLAANPLCSPARYTAVQALSPAVTSSTRLYVATVGTPGDYLDQGCSSAQGGLFAVQADGSIVALGVDGLPYAQDPVGRTIRAYDIDMVVPDPQQSTVLYVHASQGSGPDSPPEGLYKSVDGGRHWQEIDTGLSPSATIVNSADASVPVYGPGTLHISPTSSQHLVWQTGRVIYISSNGGLQWQALGSSSPTPTPVPATDTPPATPTAAIASVGQSTPAPSLGADVPASVSPLPQGWRWSQIAPQGAVPQARQDPALAWDSQDRRLLVFGGTTTAWSQAFNDLWAYTPDSNTWRVLAGGPSGRFGSAAVWDPIDQVLLIFGGQIGTGATAVFSGDLWAYRPVTNIWTRLWTPGVGGPVARSHVAAAWDATYRRLLIFGGETSENPWRVTNDLWAFTVAPGALGGSWTQLSAANSACTVTCPLPRAAALGAWEGVHGVLRLFGGRNSAQSVLSDTWTWTPSGATGGSWTEENRTVQPAGRVEGGVAFDSTHGVVVVGPGQSLANGVVDDVWADQPTQQSWQQLPVATSPQPPVRRLTQWAWDDAAGRFLLFGGRVAGLGAANDLWQLAPTAGAVPTPPVPPTAQVPSGLDEGWTVDNQGNVLVTPNQITMTRLVGARYVRVNFRLGAAPDWTNAALLSAYDTVVNRFLAAGIQVVGLVTPEATHSTQADWTANNHENTGGSGDNPFISTTYVRSALVPLVSHFHTRVRYWELWNEPNAFQSCSGTTCTGGSFIYPSNFAALLVDAYTAIKDPAPAGLGIANVTLISGGLLGHSIGGALTSGTAGADYLRNTFTLGVQTIGSWARFAATHGGAYPLDGVGQHLYLDQNLLTTRTDIATYYSWLHGTITAFGSTRPTYMTESAWSTAVVAQTTQAQNLDILFGTTRSMGFVGGATWFELQDAPPANLYFGLTDPAGQLKQSFSRYRAQAAL